MKSKIKAVKAWAIVDPFGDIQPHSIKDDMKACAGSFTSWDKSCYERLIEHGFTLIPVLITPLKPKSAKKKDKK